MNENNLKKEIEKEVKLFFQMSTFSVEVEVFSSGEVFLVEIKTEEPKMLIGERGQTLVEIQHLLRVLLRKKFQEKIMVEVDINGYKKKKEDALKDVARDIADEVVFYKKEKILPPMSSYERRIIHLALKDRRDVETESVNGESGRMVVVKPLI